MSYKIIIRQSDIDKLKEEIRSMKNNPLKDLRSEIGDNFDMLMGERERNLQEHFDKMQTAFKNGKSKLVNLNSDIKSLTIKIDNLTGKMNTNIKKINDPEYIAIFKVNFAEFYSDYTEVDMILNKDESDVTSEEIAFLQGYALENKDDGKKMTDFINRVVSNNNNTGMDLLKRVVDLGFGIGEVDKAEVYDILNYIYQNGKYNLNTTMMMPNKKDYKVDIEIKKRNYLISTFGIIPKATTSDYDSVSRTSGIIEMLDSSGAINAPIIIDNLNENKDQALLDALGTTRDATVESASFSDKIAGKIVKIANLPVDEGVLTGAGVIAGGEVIVGITTIIGVASTCNEILDSLSDELSNEQKVKIQEKLSLIMGQLGARVNVTHEIGGEVSQVTIVPTQASSNKLDNIKAGLNKESKANNNTDDYKNAEKLLAQIKEYGVINKQSDMRKITMETYDDYNNFLESMAYVLDPANGGKI